MTMAASPAANAEATVIVALSNSRIAQAPPKAAPDETPMICESTSGLRKTPCNAAPATARPSPARHTARMRGRRTSSTTRCSGSDQVASTATRWLRRIAATCCNGMPYRPTDSEPTTRIGARISTPTQNRGACSRRPTASPARARPLPTSCAVRMSLRRAVRSVKARPQGRLVAEHLAIVSAAAVRRHLNDGVEIRLGRALAVQRGILFPDAPAHVPMVQLGIGEHRHPHPHQRRLVGCRVQPRRLVDPAGFGRRQVGQHGTGVEIARLALLVVIIYEDNVGIPGQQLLDIDCHSWLIETGFKGGVPQAGCLEKELVAPEHRQSVAAQAIEEDHPRSALQWNPRQAFLYIFPYIV